MITILKTGTAFLFWALLFGIMLFIDVALLIGFILNVGDWFAKYDAAVQNIKRKR